MTRNRLAEFHRLRAIETDDCVEWPYAKSRGYGYIKIDRKQQPVARLALILATGIDPDSLQAAHGPCNNRSCMNVRHLSWKTVVENAADRKRDGTDPDPRGEGNHNARLTERDVIAIRESSEPYPTLARTYGVTRETIYRIHARRTWTHI